MPISVVRNNQTGEKALAFQPQAEFLAGIADISKFLRMLKHEFPEEYRRVGLEIERVNGDGGLVLGGG